MRLAAGREGLDDDHAAAAAWTGGRRPNISIGLRLWHGEQFARPRDVVGTGGLGEQAVVADAVEAGATCPPSAAVRQRSIADITFSWLRLTWPALA